MAFDDEHLPLSPDTGWWHASVAFPQPHKDAPRVLATALSGRRFHFLRKDAGVRLRTKQPAPELLNQLVSDGVLTGWTDGIYEPETHAFGGPEGMAVAHDVFCADSPAALAETGAPGARERAVMLLSAMIREAGLDPFEAGDVYDRWATLRHPIAPPQGPALDKAVSAMRRLMNADAALRPDPEAGWVERVAAFEDAGRQLRRLAADGRLIRGIRAVIAHHAIFAFNRAGVPVEAQAATAWLGRHVAFSTAEGADVSTRTSASADPNLPRMETTVTPVTDPAQLREALAQRLVDSGHLRSQAAIDAFRTTDRHAFLPGVDLQRAYKEDAVPIKHDEHGEMISCISAPSVVATQLEQLGALPGHKVLEAGAATGYNAALLGKIVSPGGQVWTLDVDKDLVAGASKHLAEAGIDNATAVMADGAAGLPEHAPYDRIQFTVGAGDVPAKILEQLAPDGRLVLPMRIRGSISRSFAFERDGDTWKTVSCEMATFVPLRKGVCDDVYTLVPMAGEGNVRLETFSEQDVDRDALRTVLDEQQTKLYTGVKFRQGSAWEWLYLYLACVLPNGLSRLPGQRPGFTPHFGWGSMAALDGASLAYLTIREGEDENGRYWEVGVIGHGEKGRGLAERVVDEIRAWDASGGNDAPAPGFRMTTAESRDRLTANDPRFVIDKPYSRLVVDWARKG
ncbi:protein-L-isoaspartate(D-aspartate)O-methyltransferase [Streptomyces albus]|uniref:Protein-L-isoaspartate O-methyltransferase n=1 Tax=Streptomyces albus (strain ATCC 21838 / DSM 41398 / FERM P-419 / JCM 4703 / NBRC 107858) TaxID=1081613 RepID=A0A0B5EJ86_STRA4|nr:protein-L-isoaspartate(D-aspartate)O-methyltransferase [Streptomyces albus]AOU75874.1 protein-L-isoaspartate(D-aspartate)O-methyltransferase [Streptomyces albus]AYN31681.1 methyltransferase, FxLD system [Streptomyces albus]